MKAYLSKWKRRDKPEENVTDFWFSPRLDSAACWETRIEAENDCVFFNYFHITIRSSEGGMYICKDFTVEERADNEFVVYCIAPLLIATIGRGVQHDT